MKSLAVIFAAFLCSCQHFSVLSQELAVEESGASGAWRVECFAAKNVKSAEGFKSEITYKKLGLADPDLLEALDKVSWVKTSYDALCLPVIFPRLEIVQKQGNDYYLSEFFWEGGVGLLLRSKVQARGNEFTLIVSERYELLRSAASAAEIELLIAEKIVPKPELLKYRRQ